MHDFKDEPSNKGPPRATAVAAPTLLQIETEGRRQCRRPGSIETLWTDWLQRRCRAMPAKAARVSSVDTVLPTDETRVQGISRPAAA
jgi:hypothetical protein